MARARSLFAVIIAVDGCAVEFVTAVDPVAPADVADADAKAEAEAETGDAETRFGRRLKTSCRFARMAWLTGSSPSRTFCR